MIIGTIRVPEDLFNKIEEIASKSKCTNKQVVQAILEAFIDEAKFI